MIRHLTVRVDEAQEVIERTKARRPATSRRRRVARGLPEDRQPGEGQRNDADDDVTPSAIEALQRFDSEAGRVPERRDNFICSVMSG